MKKLFNINMNKNSRNQNSFHSIVFRDKFRHIKHKDKNITIKNSINKLLKPIS